MNSDHSEVAEMCQQKQEINLGETRQNMNSDHFEVADKCQLEQEISLISDKISEQSFLSHKSGRFYSENRCMYYVTYYYYYKCHDN